jgi:hypothetical protein
MNVAAVSRHGSDATGNGSDSAPFRTIAQAVRSVAALGAGQANGMTVRIMSEGDWDVPSLDQVANDRWITIETSGSVSSDSVRFTMPGLPRADLLRFRGVTFVPSTSGSLVNPPRDYSRLLWLDRVHVAGTGRTAPTRGVFGNMMTYVTDSLFTDMPNGPTDILYVRNTRVERILSDAFSNTFMVVNSSVDDIDPLSSGAHPDVYQVYRPAKAMENVVVYGLNATDIVAQGIFFGGTPSTPHSNMVFANCVIAARSDGAGASQIGTSLNHLLLINVTLYKQPLLWRTRDLKDCGILNSCIQKMGYDGNWVSIDDLNTNVRFDSTHYIDATSYGALRLGADSTSGDPRFRNPAAWDLSPMSGSPLLGRGTLILPGDLNNSQRANPPAVGAYDASR